jgi:hypothetical protein
MRRPTWRFSWAWPIGVVLALSLASAAQAAQPLVISGGLRDFTPPAPRYVNASVLDANTAELVTMPTFPNEPGLNLLVTFVPDSGCPDIFIRPVTLGGVTVGATAVVPTDEIVDGSSPLRNPGPLVFGQGDTASLIAPTACTVTWRVDLTRP